MIGKPWKVKMTILAYLFKARINLKIKVIEKVNRNGLFNSNQLILQTKKFCRLYHSLGGSFFLFERYRTRL